MRIFLFIAMFICAAGNANAQAPNWDWAKSIGGTDRESGNSLFIDANDNIYCVGNFNGTVDFDPGIGIFNLTAAGGSDVFIVKLDAGGNFIWAKSVGGKSEDFSNSIAGDASGNIYFSGGFSDTADFDPDFSITHNLISDGLADIFISKLDNSGNLVWVRRIGGSESDIAYYLSIDHSNNINTTGTYKGTVDFDPDSSVISYLPIAISQSTFLFQLDSAGNFIWAKAMIGTEFSAGFWIAKDMQDNIYSIGDFRDTTDFDPDSLLTFNQISNGERDIFITKFNSIGNFVWGKSIGGAQNDYGYSIFVDDSGNVYTTGSFNGTVDFNPDSSADFIITSSGADDIFISKLNSSGSFIWAKVIGNVGFDEGHAISVDSAGNIYATGNYYGTVDFDPGIGTFNLISAGSSDLFVLKLNESGNFIWAKSLSGTKSDYSMSIINTTSESVYVTGSFNSPSLLFDSLSILNVDNMGNTSDIFIAKIDNILTGIKDQDKNNEFTFFPNPANANVTIVLGNYNKKILITIADITGKIIYQNFESETQTIEVTTKEFAQGIYIIKIQSTDFIKTGKLIIEK